MISKADAAAELLARRRARIGLATYIRYTTPKYVESEFSLTVCAALDKFVDDMLAGKRPILILQAPPQHGKSEMVSRKLPAYLMGRLPDLRVAAASYSATLADSMSLDVRRNLASLAHLRLFPAPAVKGRYSVDRNGEFSSPNGTGSYIGDGVGGGFTGKSADCLVAGTKVMTSDGEICIEDLFLQSVPRKVVTFNADYGLRYNEIQAVKRSPGSGIYRVTCKSGRVFEATGDHRVFTTRGYFKARELSAGDNLLSCVLYKHNPISGGHKEADQIDWKYYLLLSRLLERITEALRKVIYSLFGVRGGYGCLQSKILLEGLCKNRATQKASGCYDRVRNVFDKVCGYLYKRKVSSVLRKKVREPSARAPNDGRGQSALQGRSKSIASAASFGKILSDHASAYFKSGWRGLCSLRGRVGANRSSPHRRMGIKQRIEQSDNTVCKLSQRNPQGDGFCSESDSVWMVERVRETDTVYDIQVSGDHNFFANGILVHNCFIVDDPIKNAQEALSGTTKEGHWNWYMSTCKTRMSANSGQIIMATSWAEDDLPARICAQHAGDNRLTILRFPAINLPDEAGYNPALPAGALVPELHPLTQLHEFKRELSDYWWAALYQQCPRSLGGNVFKESGIRYYLPKDLPAKFDKMIASWDCTFKDTDGTDYVVGQIWGKVGANSYLLAQVRDRMSFTRTVREVVDLRAAWPRCREVLIEDKANGPAVIDTLKAQVPGIIPIEPDGSKLARAHAVTSWWEAGNVWLPHPDLYPWVKGLVAELTAFPAAANDDQVDALTQALRRLYPAFAKIAISQSAILAAMGR